MTVAASPRAQKLKDWRHNRRVDRPWAREALIRGDHKEERAMEAQIAEYLYMRGSKCSRAACVIAAPKVVAMVRSGASPERLAQYLHSSSLTANKGSALDTASGVIERVSKEGI